MKTERKILLLSLLTLCLVAWMGCGKKAAEEEPRDELVLEPLVGVGPIRFGMTNVQIIEHFGKPDRTFEGKVTKLNYVPSRGLSFTVNAELGLQEIGCWSEGMLPSRVTTFSGKTKEGIGIGATQEEIVTAYGQPDRKSMDSRGIIQNLHYDKLEAKFSLKENKLMSMTLEAPK
ncbi:hypothetical protein ACFL5Z_01040 [Planctomycetota bacterium]